MCVISHLNLCPFNIKKKDDSQLMFAIQSHASACQSLFCTIRRLPNLAHLSFFFSFVNHVNKKALLHKVPDSLHDSREGCTCISSKKNKAAYCYYFNRSNTKAHTHSLNVVWTELSVPICCKLPAHAQDKLLVSCIMSIFTTSLLTLYGHMRCQSSKKWTWQTGRLRGWEVGRCWVAA